MCTHTPVKSNERSLALHSAKQGTLRRPLIERTRAGKANSTTTEASPRERGGKWIGASSFQAPRLPLRPPSLSHRQRSSQFPEDSKICPAWRPWTCCFLSESCQESLMPALTRPPRPHVLWFHLREAAPDDTVPLTLSHQNRHGPSRERLVIQS